MEDASVVYLVADLADLKVASKVAMMAVGTAEKSADHWVVRTDSTTAVCSAAAMAGSLAA